MISSAVPKPSSSSSISLLLAGVIAVVILSRFGHRRPLLLTNHFATTNEVKVSEMDSKICATQRRRGSTPVILMESNHVLMERNDIGNVNHFFKDDFYPLAMVLTNHFNQSTCRLFGDFMTATNVETTRHVSSVTHASTRSFFIRSLLSHICKEESFQEVYRLGASSFPVANVSLGSTKQDATSCQCLVERTINRPPPERYPLSWLDMERKVTTFNAIRSGARDVLSLSPSAAAVVAASKKVTSVVGEAVVTGSIQASSNENQNPQQQRRQQQQQRGKRVINIIVYSRDEPLEEDSSHSRVLINAEEVVDDLRVLLRVPSNVSISDRRKEDSFVHDSNVTNNNISNENDNNKDENDEVMYDVHWVPSLLTLSNTDRVTLFSDADVFFAPHGAWMVNTVFMADHTLVLSVEKDANMVSFEAWDRFYDTRQRKVKLITDDKELAKFHPHLAVYCHVERVGNNPHTADYRLHNLIHVADAIRDYFHVQ